VKIKVVFRIDDGYVGAGPHTFYVDSDDYEGQTAQEIANTLSDDVEQEMTNVAHPVYLETEIVATILKALKESEGGQQR
jgi:hypothetical protein